MIKDFEWTPRLREKIIEPSVLLCSSQIMQSCLHDVLLILYLFCTHFVHLKPPKKYGQSCIVLGLCLFRIRVHIS